MSSAFAVTNKDIENLTDQQLTRVLHRLLILEAGKLGLPKLHVSVALNIVAPDGGQDGRIEWSEGPDPTASDWIPRRLTLFQVKATQLGPKACADDICQPALSTTKAKAKAKGVQSLKAAVQDVVEREGSYVLVYGRSCEGKMADDRVTAMRGRVKECLGATKARKVDIRVFGAEKLAEWANQHASAVSSIFNFLGKGFPVALQPWTEWKDEWDGAHASPLAFHLDSRRPLFEGLRGWLAEPRAIARLVGLPGLGKTRLALEVLARPAAINEEPEQASLSMSCVYINDGAGREHEIENTLRLLKHQGVRGCVVVDDCPIELHRKLESIIATSNLALLTLDSEPDSNPGTSRCQFHVLRSLSDGEIGALLRCAHPALDERLHLRIVALAHGFPRMVEFLVEAAKQDEPRLWELAPRDAFKKLVVRRSASPEPLYEVAKCLSILSHLGVYGDVEQELRVFAEQVCPAEHPDTVFALLRDLERAGLAERRGDYLRITPPPLAITLAGQWWESCREQKAWDLLVGGLLPEEMVDAIVDQLRRLKGHGFVEQLVNRLMGPESPFSKREQLNSAPGSRLVNSLAEIDPVAVCDALARALGQLSLADARAIDVARHDLIWALRKVARWSQNFDDAAWILLVLAAADQRPGHHSDTEFNGLFHLYLSGTETPALDRLAVLRRGLSSSHSELQRVSLEALGAAFETSGYGSIDLDPHYLGRPSRDWSPKTWGDIWNYWDAVAELVAPYLARNDWAGELVRRRVAGCIRGIVRHGGTPVLHRLVGQLGVLQHSWPEAFDELRFVLSAEAQKASLPPDTIATIEQLVIQLAPTGITERLRYAVTTPGWGEIDREAPGGVTLMAETRARALGQELASLGDEFVQYMAPLLEGEQRQGYEFGLAIGTHIAAPLSLLRTGVDLLLGVPPNERNISVLMGICVASEQRDERATRQYLHDLLSSTTTKAIAPDLMRAAGLRDTDIEALSAQLEAGALSSSSVYRYGMGRALDQISGRVLARFLRACSGVDDGGPLIALDLLGMRVFRIDVPEDLQDVARELLVSPRLAASHRDTMAGTHYRQLVTQVLKSPTTDEAYVRTLARYAADLCREDFLDHDDVQFVLRELFARSRDITWQELRAAIAKDNWAGAFYFELALRTSELSSAPFDLDILVGEKSLLEWCESDKRAQPFVAQIIQPLPTERVSVRYPSWGTFAIAFIDRFGGNVRVQEMLFMSIRRGEWGGSAVPRLTKHQRAFEELRKHPNQRVASWANRSIKLLEREIADERKRDEELELRFGR